MIRLTHAVLVIADISGYTDFITQREISLVHAEQIITDLMEAMTDRTAHPLTVNKFEGDAALLYAEAGEDLDAAVADVMVQVAALFDAFSLRLVAMAAERAHCSCEACGNIGKLTLKAFVHVGEIAIKQVRQFQELAGEEVILIHRLLKNHVPGREYVLVTEAVAARWPEARRSGRAHRESFEGLGELDLVLMDAPGRGS